MKKTAIVIFLALPLLLLAVILCSPDRALSEAENRPLRTKADIRWNVMDGGFQDWLEDYLSDQFPFRDALKRAEVRCAIAAGTIGRSSRSIRPTARRTRSISLTVRA
ncbi:MAG: hypothetical protein IIZ68_07830 [Clostridia bacterium]|nr:hypothetical protein [Clostridia bacterium]